MTLNPTKHSTDTNYTTSKEVTWRFTQRSQTKTLQYASTHTNNTHQQPPPPPHAHICTCNLLEIQVASPGWDDGSCIISTTRSSHASQILCRLCKSASVDATKWGLLWVTVYRIMHTRRSRILNWSPLCARSHISRLELLQSTIELGGLRKHPDNPACTRSVSPQTQEAGHYTEEEEESACNILCLPVAEWWKMLLGNILL